MGSKYKESNKNFMLLKSNMVQWAKKKFQSQVTQGGQVCVCAYVHVCTLVFYYLINH